MKNTKTLRFVINPAVHSKKIRGKWFLLEKSKKHVRELNEVAGFIWACAHKPTTVLQVVTKISRLSHQDKEAIYEDVENFVNSYLKLGFFIRSSK
jgi:hypothetical protein